MQHSSESRRGDSNSRDGWARSRTLVVLAVGYQWFYNGANFVAFKIGGDAIHPLLLATMRFAIAAVAILPLGLLRLRAHPTRTRECVNAAGLGVVMLVGSQTTAILGTHMLPAGVASVFGSAAPLFLALFAWIALREPIGWRQTCGIGLGFVGLVLMAWFTSGADGFKPLGAALTLFASACWAGGSLWARQLRLPADPVVALTAQLTAAAVVLVIVAASTGEPGRTDVIHLPAAAWGSLGFLVVGSTLVGYAVFLAVNSDVSPTIANTFNYAAPVVALLLSAALLGEHLSFAKLFAAGVALSGVALMIRGGAPGHTVRPRPRSSSR
ncbi:EamA family transporter [Luteibacter sp. SG786]|uniref:DMT family transporter n=1 Tax=Luteibacter sp. SG786 TaxID=2587130 RepID=UPI00142153AE|nr:EamA family transporter [Luteibacter sp. SG786]NII53806.1 drug/metabolite transporter (DMT)-like permease [Luteibacter sp. SG786]